MIFVCPLLLIGTALVFEARRIDRRLFAGSVGFVLLLVLSKAIQLGWPYYDAPGSAIPAVLSFYRHWTTHSLRLGLLGVLALSVLAIAFRRRRGVAAATVVLGFAWLLAGQIAFTVGIDHVATGFTRNLPAPLELGRPGGRRAAGDLPGPGDQGPERREPHRVLEPVDPQGREPRRLRARSRSVLHAEPCLPRRPARGPRPLPTSSPTPGSGSPSPWPPRRTAGRWCSTTRRTGSGTCSTPSPRSTRTAGARSGARTRTSSRNRRGTLLVTLSRTAYGGTAPPARTALTVGTVKLDRNGNPELGRIERRLHPVIENGTQQIVRIPVTQTPVRVEVRVPART